MDNRLGQQVSNHFEFLGYDIELDTSEPRVYQFFAKSPGKPILKIRIGTNNIGFIVSYFPGWVSNDSFDSLEFHKDVQKINQESYFSKWYAQKDISGIVVVTLMSWFFGYEKKTFSIFIEGLLNDITMGMVELKKHRSQK